MGVCKCGFYGTYEKVKGLLKNSRNGLGDTPLFLQRVRRWLIEKELRFALLQQSAKESEGALVGGAWREKAWPGP